MTWAVYEGDVSMMLALGSIGVENDRVVEKPDLMEYGMGPYQRFTLEA